MKKNKDLKPDGYIEPTADAIENDPEFVDEYLDLAHKHLKETSPSWHAVMERIKKENGSK